MYTFICRLDEGPKHYKNDYVEILQQDDKFKEKKRLILQQYENLSFDDLKVLSNNKSFSIQESNHQKFLEAFVAHVLQPENVNSQSSCKKKIKLEKATKVKSQKSNMKLIYIPAVY